MPVEANVVTEGHSELNMGDAIGKAIASNAEIPHQPGAKLSVEIDSVWQDDEGRYHAKVLVMEANDPVLEKEREELVPDDLKPTLPPHSKTPEEERAEQDAQERPKPDKYEPNEEERHMNEDPCYLYHQQESQGNVGSEIMHDKMEQQQIEAGAIPLNLPENHDYEKQKHDYKPEDMGEDRDDVLENTPTMEEAAEEIEEDFEEASTESTPADLKPKPPEPDEELKEKRDVEEPVPGPDGTETEHKE